MAAKKKSKRSTKSTSRGASARTPKKKWKAPKNTFLSLVSLPFRLIYNLTSGWKFHIRWPVRLALLGLLGIFMAVCLWAVIYIPRAYIGYNMKHVENMPARTLVFAKSRDDYGNLKELGRLHGDNRYIVKYEDVSEHFIKALLAQEDEVFMEHHGIDIIGLFRIPYHFIRYKKKLGASTITMQLARNSYPLGDGLDRKLLEMALALRIEQNYSKEEILEHYMNRFFIGHSMYGIEAAARSYFEKNAKHLTLSEAAMLAGMIRGPNLFSPFRNIERSIRERNRVLDRMVNAGFITKEVAEKTKKEALHITPRDRRTIHDTYVMDLVDRELKTILKEKPHIVKTGKLRVYTTIDHKLQNAMEKHIEGGLSKIENKSGYKHETRSKWLAKPPERRGDPSYLQAAAVCLENRTGAVRAVAGGRSAKESNLDRATQTNQRQHLASIVKPFVYLAAFNQGMRNTVADSQIRGWPHNHDDKYYAEVSVTKAISESRNCAAVHAGLYAKKENVSETLRKAGFRHYKIDDGSAFLGTGTATPWEVASAYSIFANGGTRFRPYLIEKITDLKGNILYETPQLVHTAAKREPAWKVSAGLKAAVETGTGRKLRTTYGFRSPCGGKTGTSNDVKDAWFAGYTSELSCAVWVGFDTPKEIIKNGSGTSLALPIWAHIMKSAEQLGDPSIPRAVIVNPNQ